MDTLSKITWVSLIISMTVEIAILKSRISGMEEKMELEWRIDEIPRYIRKEYPSEYDVVDICRGTIEKVFGGIINVGNKKGTDE